MWDGCDLTAKKNQFTGENIKIEPVEVVILFFFLHIFLIQLKLMIMTKSVLQFHLM